MNQEIKKHPLSRIGTGAILGGSWCKLSTCTLMVFILLIEAKPLTQLPKICIQVPSTQLRWSNTREHWTLPCMVMASGQMGVCVMRIISHVHDVHEDEPNTNWAKERLVDARTLKCIAASVTSIMYTSRPIYRRILAKPSSSVLTREAFGHGYFKNYTQKKISLSVYWINCSILTAPGMR